VLNEDVCVPRSQVPADDGEISADRGPHGVRIAKVSRTPGDGKKGKRGLITHQGESRAVAREAAQAAV